MNNFLLAILIFVSIAGFAQRNPGNNSFLTRNEIIASRAAPGDNTDITGILLNQSGLKVKGGSSNYLTIKPNETLSNNRVLNVSVNDADRTVSLSGNLTVSATATVSGTNTGDQDLSGYLTSATAASTYQPLDGDLTTLAGLTATTDNFIVSVSSAWASRTPSQVRTTLGLVVGTDVEAHDADLTTIAGLTATTDNFIVSVSSAWASRTPSQVKTTLSLNNVENTAVSTWAGTTNITTVGTVGTGTWNATAIAETKGGTNQTSYTTGDFLYASASNTLAKLGIGSRGQRLVVNGSGVPAWTAINKASGTNIDPTGTTSTTGVMAGLSNLSSGCIITPANSGTILIIISGQAENNTGDDGFKFDIRYGTGTAPSNGNALTGTVVGSTVTGSSVASSTTTSVPIMPFSHQGIVTGLTAGTAYWIDLGIYAVTGGTATFSNVNVSVIEL